MKYLKLKLLLVITFAITFFSCEKYFDEANIDPDNPTAVPVTVILPQVQVRLAYTVEGDLARYIGIYTQHVDGIGRQFAVIGNYGIQPGDVDNVWSNCYSGILMDNRQIYDNAIDNGYNHFAGVSRAIEAYTIMMVTDFWGDVPYSESFQGTDLLQPKYDTQESIYAAIFTLLDEARTLLNSGDGDYPIGSEDLIYSGDVSKWIKFCNVLEARGRLHLAKKDNANYQAALTAINKGNFSSSADDAKVAFGTGSTSTGPWYQYIEQRDDCEVGSGYKAILASLNDPRDSTYGYAHALPHPVFTRDRAVPLLTFVEAKFIEAECKFKISGASVAHADYISGITSSFTEANTSDSLTSYLSQTSVNPGTASITLNHIMTQKYLALYTQPEVFNDWRRTNLPALSPVSGTQIPRRLPYSDAERQANPNTPAASEVTIYDRIWWDN